MEEYSFEKLTPAHFPILKELYLNAFNIRIDPEGIQKRFDTAQLGCEQIGFMAICSSTGIAAAYYGVFPMKAFSGDQVIQIAQSGDTMTHSAHRKKGLFVRLASLTYAECERKGIKLIIGQPNKDSYHGLVNSLGWTHLDDMIRWDLKLKLKTFPLGRIIRHSGFFSKLYHRYARFILKKFLVAGPASFHNTIRSDYLKILRDQAYLSYKSADDKLFLEIEGVMIWVNLSDIFWIGDFSNYEKISPKFIKRIKKLIFLLGYNTVSFNLNKSLPLPEGLKSFAKGREEASCFYYLDRNLEGRNLLLTAADFDTF